VTESRVDGKPVVMITEPRVEAAASALQGRQRDTLYLTWEGRRWTRKRVRTTGGREVALALPTGTVLRPDDVVAVREDWYLIVEGRPEPVLVLVPRDRDEAVRIALEVGNRHFPLAVEGDRLLVPDDSAMVQLVERLGARWERAQKVFDPLHIGAHAPHDARPFPGRGSREAPAPHA